MTSDRMGMRQAIESEDVMIVDVGPTPSVEDMERLDASARSVGGVRRIAPSVYVLYRASKGRGA